MFTALIKTVYKNLELIFWISGLIILSIISPDQNHFSLCPLNQLGFVYCPGCGLGKSISLIFHLQFSESLNAHPLGILALIIITLRIIQLIKNTRREHNA